MHSTNASFLSAACRGKLLGKDLKVNGVKIDSRQAVKGDMFVCVVGEKNDGHDYADSAYENGCRVFLMSDPDFAEDFCEDYDDVCVILSDDTEEAFKDMACAYMAQFRLIKIGVTGSVGKTTTKMLTAAVMGAKYNTICTQKNLNTKLGLCLTAFNADETTQAIVFEMGMDRKNEIAEYVDWVRPELAIITNVGISHMEKLGSRDNIANAKLEISKYFRPENTLIVNRESDYLNTDEEIIQRLKNNSQPTDFNIVGAGEGENADFIISSVNSEGENCSFDIKYKDSVQHFELHLAGKHNAFDAALAVAAGMQFGIGLEDAAKALSKVQSTSRRMQIEHFGEITLIDDSYNASPDSMKAALEALKDIKGKRKIAVLADMLELGEQEEEGHLKVGRLVGETGVNILIAVGDLAIYYLQGLNGHGNTTAISVEDPLSAMNLLSDILTDGDVVLVKGSNSTGVSEVAENLRENL